MTGGADPTDPREALRAGLHDAVRRSGLAELAPGEVPRGRDLLRAIGGVRGLIESILPGLGFLVTYTITQDVVLSVLAPVAVALIFVVIRLGARTPPTLAFAGLFGVGISAALALMTGRAEDNFVPGLLINLVSLIVVVTSIIVRWPVIGVIVGVLSGDGMAWRRQRARRHVLTLATWLWAGFFALRLLVQAPMYFAGETQWLAATKLVMGVPLYAGMIWVTWLLVRTVYARSSSTDPDGTGPDAAVPDGDGTASQGEAGDAPRV